MAQQIAAQARATCAYGGDAVRVQQRAEFNVSAYKNAELIQFAICRTNIN